MSDRNNPKLSMHPPGARKPAETPETPQSVDPLVELARLVSGRSGPAPSPAGGAAKSEAAPAPVTPPTSRSDPGPLPSEADLARDLESELLNELQASFAMVPEVAGRPSAQQAVPPPAQAAAEPVFEAPEEVSPPPVEPPPAAAKAPDPESSFRPPTNLMAEDGLPEDILTNVMNTPPAPPRAVRPLQSAQPQQRQPTPQPPPPQQTIRSPLAGLRRPTQAEDQTGPMPSAENPRVKPPPAAPTRRESLANRIARAAQAGSQEEAVERRPRADAPARAAPPTRAAPPQRPAAIRPPQSVERKPESDSAAFRPAHVPPQPPAEAVARPPRQTESRWDPPPAPESDAPIEASRFAPASSVSFRPGGHGGPGEPDSSADELLFAADDDTYFDEPPVDDQYDVVPGYGDDDLLPYPEDELAAMQPRRSRRVPLAIAGLLAVLVIGGAAVIMLRSGGTNEPPPIIAADSAPTKITPENAGTSEGDGQSKLIYDRVDPNSEVADSKLVVTDDNPIADIPPVPEDTTSNEVSRVILGGGPGVDSASNETGAPGTGNSQPAGNGGMTVASSAQEPASIGPRKVRTVVVRPDGTIVSNEAVPQEQGDAQDVPQNETQSALTELPPASETPPAPAADENPLLSDNFGVEAIDNPTGETSAGGSASASIPDFPPPTSNQAAPSRPSAQAPKVVASTGSANATSSQSSAGLGGGFLVQVSSQRSEATALETFAELQRRYPSILGDRAPDIQRADLGDRGIYYRVRVGYPTREQAVTMCENLKAAGGDCLLATR